MAAKTLYEVLEVAQSATPETIEAAYKSISARLRVRAERDREGAAILQTAVDDAYRTLSNPELRKRYDASRAAPRPQPIYAVEVVEDERPWFIRYAVPLIALAIAITGGYFYQSHAKEQRALAETHKREREEYLARQKAAGEELEREEAEQARLREQRNQEAEYQRWLEQTRRDSAAYARQQESLARQQEAQRTRQEHEAARQRQMEEFERQREEAQARARLEQDKRRLQQLEQEHYGNRR